MLSFAQDTLALLDPHHEVRTAGGYPGDERGRNEKSSKTLQATMHVGCCPTIDTRTRDAKSFVSWTKVAVYSMQIVRFLD
eukprot:scaffold1805_cov104-Cylindrotheca_fusiformis.AAC.9